MTLNDGNRKMRGDRRLLFQGELSDAPGRNESWNDYVRYRGNNRWELSTEGTDFSGTSAAESLTQAMSTRALVLWVLERDAGLAKVRELKDSGEPEDDDPPRTLGPYGERLRAIASSEGASHCLACLDGWIAGTWPRPSRQRAVRVLDVVGVARRGVWRGVYHKVYEVATNLGPAFLYPPGPDCSARIILRTEHSMAAGRTVKVPKALMSKIDSWRSAYDAL